MNKTLKEQFLKDIKQGTMIDVTFVTYQNETFVNRYVFASNTFFSITDNSDAASFIDLKDVEDDFNIFNTLFKKVNITNIIEPVEYKCLFYNPSVVDLTKKEIEKILGYKINIVEE